MRASMVVTVFLVACGGGGEKNAPAKPVAAAPASQPPAVVQRRSVIEVDAPPEEVPPPEGPAPSSVGFDTGVPECDDYMYVFERLVTMCGDKFGTSVDAMKQALEAQQAAFLQWRDLDDGSRAAVYQAAGPGCKQGADAIKQTAASMGCAL